MVCFIHTPAWCTNYTRFHFCLVNLLFLVKPVKTNYLQNKLDMFHDTITLHAVSHLLLLMSYPAMSVLSCDLFYSFSLLYHRTAHKNGLRWFKRTQNKTKWKKNKTLDHRLIYSEKVRKKIKKRKTKWVNPCLGIKSAVCTQRFKMLQSIPLNHNYSALDKLPIHRIVIRQPFFRFL